MTTTTQISSLRTQLAERRMVRQQRRRIREELSTYRSPSEVAELYAVLGRADSDSLAEIEDLLPTPAR